MSAPEPTVLGPVLARWETTDGIVVADMHPDAKGVFIYPVDSEKKHLDDPEALAEAILAAADMVKNGPPSKPLTPEQEIAFRKDWDARVVPSTQPSGERGPGGAPTIIGTRPRKQDTP